MSEEINLVKEILHKMDSLDKNVDEINVILAVQAEQLKSHIKRTEVLEEAMRPVTTHINRVNSLILLLGGILGLIGAIEGALKILNLFR